MKLYIKNDKETLAQKLVEFIVQQAKKAVQKTGRFTFALSGGSTPQRTFELLATQNDIPWQNTHLFWGDERWVKPTDDRYNAKTAFETFINKVPIPQHQVYPISGEVPPEESATQYESLLKSIFSAEQGMDLTLLGLGEDGHTASLFPGTDVLQEQKQWVKEVYVPEQEMYRITMTAPFINQSKDIVFLVTGENKAERVKDIIQGDSESANYPAQLIQPTNGGTLHWFLDKAAAHSIKVS